MKKYIFLMNLGFCLITSNIIAMLRVTKKATPKQIRFIRMQQSNDFIAKHTAPNPYDKINRYNEKDNDGNTLLHIAVILFDHSSLKDPIKWEVLEQILRRNPNPFIPNQNDNTCLQEAQLLQERGNFFAAEAVKQLTEYENWYNSTFFSEHKE